MKIAYASILPADDPRSWSGLNYYIANCLRAQGFEVEFIGPLHDPAVATWSKVKAVGRQLVSGGRYLWTRDPSLLRHYAAAVARQLEGGKYDLLFSPGTEPIAYLPSELKLPVVFWTDAPFGAVHDYYAWYRGLSRGCVAAGMDCDRRALQRARFGIYSSDWAARHAVEKHGADPARVAVIPFGANMESRVAATEIDELVARRLAPPWQFLFVGVEWERKGGDVVLDTVKELNALGFPSELTIVGCEPPARCRPLPDFVKLEGYLDKRSEAGRRRLTELYRSTLFFFMPSQAEAYGIVFCEANAHAVPCLACPTGGIPTIIRNGQNGYLLPADAPIRDYVNVICAAAEAATYRQLAETTLRAFDERLNWEASGRQLRKLFAEIDPGIDTAVAPTAPPAAPSPNPTPVPFSHPV